MCRRKPVASPEQKSYMKNNAGIKPPDLWIHHDQMELKNMDKNNHATIITTDATSSSGAMTLPRPVVHEYESESNLTHVTNSLDKRSYVPGYISKLNSNFALGLWLTNKSLSLNSHSNEYLTGTTSLSQNPVQHVKNTC